MGFLAPQEFHQGLLGRGGIPLLLVVIEDTCGRLEIGGIGRQRGASAVEERPQFSGLAKQPKVALHQLGRPKRLKRLVIEGEGLLAGAARARERRLRLDRENLILGKGILVRSD